MSQQNHIDRPVPVHPFMSPSQVEDLEKAFLSQKITQVALFLRELNVPVDEEHLRTAALTGGNVRKLFAILA